ncbi:MAG: hypothetical protein KME40_08710 [Komarekiella atlantica HA4396-MV6]|nr:hypothetical protein [Komarekiella atlantica HA4396-MV6]
MTNTVSHNGLNSQPKMSSDLVSSERQSNEVKVNQNANEAVAQSQVQLSSDGLQIIHATTGRVRIRASEDSFRSRLESISQHLRQQCGVKEVVINQQTGSMIVTYDENQLSLPQVLELLQEFGIHQPQALSESVSEMDAFAAWKSLDFWKEQSISFIPLMTGFAVTGGMGVSGLAAIPVYMITADATRRVIDYLEPQISGAKISKTSQTTDTIPRQFSLSNRKGKSAREDKNASQPSSEEESKSVFVNKNTGFTALAKIAYRIVHAIEGRIRFNMPRLAEDRAYAKRLERLVKSDAHVLSVRVNCDAASIAIAYQPSEINITHWVSLMELALQTNPPNNLIKITEQQPSPEPVSQSSEPMKTTTVLEGQPLDISSLWADLRPASLSYSLALMANFPL